MLNVVMLNDVMLNVIMLNVVRLNVVWLNVVMLSVIAPEIYTKKLFTKHFSLACIYLMLSQILFLDESSAIEESFSLIKVKLTLLLFL